MRVLSVPVPDDLSESKELASRTDPPVQTRRVDELAARSAPALRPVPLAGQPLPAPADARSPSDPTFLKPGSVATIEVAPAPGKGGAMDVVVAAEVIRRVNRTRQVVNLVSQLIIRGYDEEALHAETCRFLVSFGGYLMAWVGLAEEKPEKVVRPVAHAGLEPNFLQALKITWSNDLSSRSPTSRAIQEQRPHVVRRIPAEPNEQPGSLEPVLYGFTATCALPLQFGGHGMGALTIHSAEPDAFGAEEVSLLRELANDLAAGVIGLRERAKRQILEERFAAVVDAAADSIIGCDDQGAVSDWSQGAVRMFGYSREEVLGRPLARFLVPPERHDEDVGVQAAVARGQRVPRFETVRRCKDGTLIPTSVAVSPILSGDGMVVGSTVVEHDVTEARRADGARRAQQLEEAEATRLKGLERLRKTFMSEASHELNTPLTPLRTHVESLAEDMSLTEQQRTHVVVIERNVLRLCNLVKDMLESSRLETGRFKLELTDTPLAVLVADAVRSLSETAAKAEVTLKLGPMTRLVTRADRNRVGQVLYNLLTNAISFSPKAAQVTASTAMEDGEATVRIRDMGAGLSVDQIGKLFQPFSRPHEGSGSAPKGTGLGLFISKGIIEQHGGRIWAESGGPGAGSCFAFTLPLAQMAPGRTPATPVPASPTTLATGRVAARNRRTDQEAELENGLG